jgi:hypothetical protein
VPVSPFARLARLAGLLVFLLARPLLAQPADARRARRGRDIA